VATVATLGMHAMLAPCCPHDQALKC